MPRPVVPILRFPRKRSVTLSIVRVVRRDQVGVTADQQLGRVDAALVQPAQLGEQDRRVDDDAVADDRECIRARGFRKGAGAGRTSGRRRPPCGRRCCRPGSAPRSRPSRRAGRWPFPCPRHPTEHRAAQVRAQAYTPSGRGMSNVRMARVVRRPPRAVEPVPRIDEAPGATATGALAPRDYLRKDRGVGSRPGTPADTVRGRRLLVVIDPVARRTDGESVRIAKDVLCAGAQTQDLPAGRPGGSRAGAGPPRQPTAGGGGRRPGAAARRGAAAPGARAGGRGAVGRARGRRRPRSPSPVRSACPRTRSRRRAPCSTGPPAGSTCWSTRAAGWSSGACASPAGTARAVRRHRARPGPPAPALAPRTAA